MFKQSSVESRIFWKSPLLSRFPMTCVNIRPVEEEKNICGHCGEMRIEASNLPSGFSSRTGGLMRRSPSGGSAKGMPLKDSTSARTEPVIMDPSSSFTVGASLRASSFKPSSGSLRSIGTSKRERSSCGSRGSTGGSCCRITWEPATVRKTAEKAERMEAFIVCYALPLNGSRLQQGLKLYDGSNK